VTSGILLAMPTIDEARGLWEPETTYLNTASYGLPPRPAWEELQAALADWRAGRVSWEPWQESVERARAAFARLVSAPADTVAIGANVSQFSGLVAASLPDGARVVCPDVEFTSNLWPFLAQERRGVTVAEVPADRLTEAIDASTDLVAFSAVQSSTGAVADLDAVAAAAAHHGALTCLDATQAVGWLPLDASRFDFVVCAAYKWLLSPRGTGFMTVRPERMEGVIPHAAGWYAADDVHGSYYGGPLDLAAEARRFDLSPAWHPWVGAAPAIELLAEIGVEAIRDHDVRLANAFRAGLGLEPSDSAIVSADLPGAAERLAGSGIMAAVRDGHLRTSWHLYNTDADAESALKVLRGQTPYTSVRGLTP
jgi:selenocysteine lyase/cysteine desulfurase